MSAFDHPKNRHLRTTKKEWTFYGVLNCQNRKARRPGNPLCRRRHLTLLRELLDLKNQKDIFAFQETCLASILCSRVTCLLLLVLRISVLPTWQASVVRVFVFSSVLGLELPSVSLFPLPPPPSFRVRNSESRYFWISVSLLLAQEIYCLHNF